jgi:hypothetical protein
MAALFLGGVIYKEKKKGGERENASVWMDSKQALKLISFLFYIFWVDARCRHLGVWKQH